MRIATYDITNATFDEIVDAAESGILETFRTQPGFVRYGVVDIGDSKCISISLWETSQQADDADSVAAVWVMDNLADRLRLKSTVIGDLAFFKGHAPVPVAAIS